MASSVRSGAPRPAIRTTNSSNSIHIDREVTVVTSPANGARNTALPNAPPGHGRAQSSHGPSTATPSVPVLNRWNSMSKMSTPATGHGLSELASNKENMRALAEFLRRSTPPPSNFMSRPDSDVGSLSSRKKSGFKIFRHQKKRKRARHPKLLRLPDSAVAATTISGARHIAISIPLKYDYPYYEPPAQTSTPALTPLSQSMPPLERGAVIVLKPVDEVREPRSPIRNTARDEQEGRRQEAKAMSDAASTISSVGNVLGPETTRTLENYYAQLHWHQMNRMKSSNAAGKLPESPNNSRINVPPDKAARPDSTQTDPRHSGGTVYSTVPIGSASHSRVPSNASSVPSTAILSALILGLPPRKSSATRLSPAVQADLARAYQAKRQAAIGDIARASFASERSAVSAGESTSDATIVAKAGKAQGQSTAAGVQSINRNDTPKALDTPQPLSPAPNQHLPNVPESPIVPSFPTSPSSPVDQKNHPTIPVMNDMKSKDRSGPTADKTKEGSKQSRQDRVKARKLRDMATLRDNLINEKVPLTETVSSTNPQILVTIPPKSVKRGGITQDGVSHKRGFIAISEIMLVADLPPYTGVVTMKDLPFYSSQIRTRRRIKNPDSNDTSSPRGTHTPPSSAGSETDTTVLHRLRARASKSPLLDAKRQERRAKRNMSLKERDIEARLGRLERDNRVLMNTLGGIATSFGELSRVLPVTGLHLIDHGMLADVDGETTEGEMKDGESKRTLHTNEEREKSLRALESGPVKDS